MNVTALTRVGGTDRGEQALKALVDHGHRAVPELLAVLRRGEYNIHHIRALESITGESLGIRESAWRKWWKSARGASGE